MTALLCVGLLLRFVFRRRIATTFTEPTSHANSSAIPTSLDRSARALGKQGLLHEAVQMLNEIHPNVHSSTYIYLLQCCIRKKALEQGNRIHGLIVNHNERRYSEDIVLQNTLLAMYVKCGSLVEARSVFDEMLEKNVFSWNVMIEAYRKQGISEKALSLFREMEQNGVQPNEFTFSSVVPACASLESMADGVDIHRKILKTGFHSHSYVVNALIDMYGKFGTMHKAHVLFDKMEHRNTISWTAMVAGYVQNGLLDEAVKLFQEMPQRNTISWNAMIAGYTQNGFLKEAEKLFKEMHERDTFSWTAMIAGYAQNGLLEEAAELFKQMPQRNSVSWTAMISGYAQNGQGLKALRLFHDMSLTGLRPDSITFASIIPVCATFAALQQGMEIHGKIIRSGFLSHVIVINALIDMYAKCGGIQEARLLFDEMHNRDTTSWTAMIAGYATHGCGNEAIKLFEQMKHFGISSNHVTLLSVLSACSHAGLVKEGYQIFNSMSEYHHITPAMEHYVCMVDLLGRAGCLDEAKDFINNMPIKPDAGVWTCLLGACRIHNSLEIAEFVAQHLLELNPQNSLPYVLLSNIYATSGKWNEIVNIRKMMKERGIRKLSGYSWIEVNKQVHTFIVGDRSHPKTDDIYAELDRLSQVMKAAGYIPDTKFVLQDVKEEEKEQILSYHSEKLAIAFGLLNTSPSTTIRIVKNLRVCGDCHSATKFISKIVAREIVVRDANRYHHFKNGQCSCGDYW